MPVGQSSSSCPAVSRRGGRSRCHGPARAARHGATARAIPTWVGKSAALWSEYPSVSGHPHVGGEIMSSYHVGVLGCGPSPRGWGNLLAGGKGLCFGRAIPTWVGKSAGEAGRGDRVAGHPHVGGEIQGSRRHGKAVRGPSPRGWGNQTGPQIIRARTRAIPTWVGKSASSALMLL